MIRVPIDPPGRRRKLDVQWMRGIWVGRLDESDGHGVLTPHGRLTGRSVRRLAGNLRVQPDLVEELKSRVQDPALSQAELLKVLPASVPIRLAGGTDTDQLAEEQHRAAQREHAEGLVDDRARAEITRPFRSLEDDNDKDVKRQRLGEPLATTPEEDVGVETSDIRMGDTAPLVHEETRRTHSTEPEELCSGSSGPKRLRTGCVRVSTVNALPTPSTRSEESIVKSRAEHLKNLIDTGAVNDWNREDAIKTGSKILSGNLLMTHTRKNRVRHVQGPICVCSCIGCGQHVADRSSGSKEGSQHHVL